MAIRAMRQAADTEEDAHGEVDGLKEAFLDRCPTTAMDALRERWLRGLKPQETTRKAAHARTPQVEPHALRDMLYIVDRSELMKKPPALVEPLKMIWKPATRTANATARLYSPEICQ